jgi:hypothetical protein
LLLPQNLRFLKITPLPLESHYDQPLKRYSDFSDLAIILVCEKIVAILYGK